LQTPPKQGKRESKSEPKQPPLASASKPEQLKKPSILYSNPSNRTREGKTSGERAHSFRDDERGEILSH